MGTRSPRTVAASGVALQFRRFAIPPLAVVVAGAAWLLFNHAFEPPLDERLSLPETVDEALLIGFASVIVTLVQLRRWADERRLVALATAVESIAGSVILSAPDGTIEYVNPAFVRATGYAADEAVGQHPGTFLDSETDPRVWAEKREALDREGSWSGEWALRTKSGAVLREEVTTSAVSDSRGRVVRYVTVTRNISREREIADELSQEVHERAAVVAALARLQPGESAEATAAAICREIVAIDGLDHAAVIEFRGPRQGLVLARLGGPGWPVEPGDRLPATRTAYLARRAANGPWTEPWRSRPEDGPYGVQAAATGIEALAYAPIRNGDGLLGVVVIGTHDPARRGWVLNHGGVAVAFAATASALLAGWFEAARRSLHERRRIEAIISHARFAPLFQPIVDVATREALGYEALTRFADGTPPDACFRAAWAVGLGAELELATLGAALEAARSLPSESWLDLNVSPRLVLEKLTGLAALLAAADRPLVLEITEHDLVADYGALRAALASLGPDVRVAVDDAGAGAANLRHIVELRPDFVKLDTELVRGIRHDLTRQALVVGMRYFARRSGSRLIAEGIEERADASLLRELGVELGQGYWYRRPATAEALARSRSFPGRPARGEASIREVAGGI